MERVKRRWWTRAISLIAVVVVAGAALSGAFQLAVLAVPGYRSDLAAWVSGVAGRPVQIGGIALTWRGLAPRLDLSNITLYSEDENEQLSVERLSLGVGLRRLLVGEWVPTRLELSGLRISASIDERGAIRVAGFEPDAADDAVAGRERWLDDLNRFEYVRLVDCELHLRHESLDGRPLTLRLDSVDIDRTAQGFQIAAELRLPPDRGGEVTLDAEIAGPVSELSQWSGRFDIKADALRPQGWLQPWLQPGAHVAVAGLNVRTTGEIGAGRVTRARLELASGALVLARAGVLSSARQASLVADYLRNPRGWRVDVSDLSFDERLLLRGSLRRDDVDDEAAWDFDADRLDLDALGPWTGVWRDGAAWTRLASRAAGRVEGLVVRVRGGVQPARYSLRARLDGVGLRADHRFGIAGLSGTLSADETGGQAQIDGGPVRLELPAALDVPAEFSRLGADLRWRREADGWRIGAERFEFAAASLTGDGRALVQLPDLADASPLVDIQANLAAADALDARPYMPRHWPDSLKAWLTRSLIAARVPRGELRIRGPLADFPFHSHPTGAWSLDLDVADAALEFAPGWPRLDDVRARLQFRGNGLTITSDRAGLLGNRLQSAEVRFEDFGDHLIAVRGSVQGELSRLYAWLRASPLRRPLAGLLERTAARGDAEVDVQLRIPLDHAEQTSVNGRVSVSAAQFRYAALDPPVTALRGTLAFTEHGVSAEELQGRFADLPLQLRIDSEEGSRGVIRGSFPFAPQADGSGASQFVPAFLRPLLRGRSLWQLELPLRDGDGALRLRSDLVGTSVDLPAPLGKPADEPVDLRLRIGADDQAPVRVGVGYGERLGVDLIVAAESAGWRTGALHARLGAGAAPPAVPGRFLIDGRLDRLDIPVWLGLLGGGGANGIAIDRAELDAGRLVWGNRETPAAHLRYRPTADGWQVDLDGEGASGTLVWRGADGGHLEARLQQLRVDILPAETTAAATDEAAAVFDPARVPTFDLSCERLIAGGADLGRAHLQTARFDGGQVLRHLRLEGGIAGLDASGAWRRVDARSSAELRFDLDSSDIARLLAAFGYARNLEAQRAHFTGEAAWAPSADGLRWELATGGIHLDIDAGQLRAVQPGASRILGLINFYALPRRLLLNFDDVVGEGLAFDRIRGNFALAGGAATTADLHIEGPSLRMDIKGRVGLLDRDYDQRVTVYPDVSAGVTLGAVLLGGPAVGALVLLAQELLDKPLDQATQLSYRITGPWDNPRVERAEGAGSGPGAPAATPSPAPPVPQAIPVPG
ncbi:YhdP family protein [Fontimonas sp. SYSU GA230001]|uniref:YhdP family protein n=1 Tax=Fontimonas sp. SYSU GA230001 TaxID=3142450 RepID=UPI0032B48007